MNKKKNIFNYFDSILVYESDPSKIFSKKDQYIPILNSKKNLYSHKYKKNVYERILMYTAIPLMLIILYNFIFKIFYK